MGMRQKIGDFFLKVFSPEWMEGWSSGGSSGGVRISRYDKEALMRQDKELVHACMDLRAMTAVKTPLRVFVAIQKGESILPKTKAVSHERQKQLKGRSHLTKWTGKNVEIEEVVDDNNALYKLVNNFNSRDTRASIITIMMEQIDLIGNCYFEIERDKVFNIPIALWPTYPQNMAVITGKDKDRDKVIGYEYRQGTTVEKFTPEEILHIKSPNPNDLVYGAGIIERLIDTLVLDDNMNEHAKAVFRNQGSPSMIITPSGDPIGSSQIKRVEAGVRQNVEGVKKTGSVLFLNADLKAQIISQTFSDLSYIEGRSKIEEKISAAFHVPLAFLKTDKVNKANAEVAETMLPRYAVEPRLTQIEEQLNKDLSPQFDVRLFVAFDSPVPEDRKQEREDIKVHGTLGILTINELRAKLGRPPYEDIPDGWEGTLPALRSSASSFAITDEGADEAPKAIKTKALTTEERIVHWKKFDAKLTRWEIKIIKTCKKLFREMYNEVIDNIERSDYVPNEAIELPKANDPDNISNTWVFGSDTWEKRFEGELMPLIKGMYIEGGEESLDDLVAGIGLDMENPRAVAEMDRMAIKIKKITDTSEKRIRKTFKEAIEAGETIRDIKKRVEKEMGIAAGPRSTVIARTTSTAAYNGGSFEGAIQSGVAKTKDWLSTKDDRVREEHEAIDGETAPIDKTFSNGLMYPGDPSGAAGQVVQCRCTMIFGI